MNEIARTIQNPISDMARLALANRVLSEERDTARKVNAVLMNEIDSLEKALEKAKKRDETLRTERDDARRERNRLRMRRDERYRNAIANNCREAKEAKRRLKRFVAKAFCAVFSVLFLFVLGSKALAWLQYWFS